MWWEIIPSFAIITGVMTIPSLFHRTFNRALYGTPCKRNCTDIDPYGTSYYRRDTQHSEKSLWLKFFPAPSSPGSPYQTYGLEAINCEDVE